MINFRTMVSLLAATFLLATGFGPGTVHSSAAQSQPSTWPLITSVAVNQTNGHVFVSMLISGQPGKAGVGRSWITELDGPQGRILRTIPVANDLMRVEVNDRTNRLFSLHGGLGPSSTDFVTTFEASTGKILRRTSCGTGPMLGSALAPKLGRLFLLTNGPRGLTLHELDATSGKHLREVVLPQMGPSVAVSESTGRLLVPAVGGVLVYDLHSLRSVASLPVQFAAYRVAFDESYSRVVVAGGKGFNTLYFFNAGNWRRVATLPIGKTSLSGLAFGDSSSKLFALSSSTSSNQGPTSDAKVTVIDRKTIHVVRTTSVGVDPTQALADVRTHRVFVLSGPHLADAKASTDFLLTIFDARSGAVVTTSRISSKVAGSSMVLDSKRGVLYLYGMGLDAQKQIVNRLAVVNTQSGAVVHSLTLPNTPTH